jgi:hypothetical protein
MWNLRGEIREVKGGGIESSGGINSGGDRVKAIRIPERRKAAHASRSSCIMALANDTGECGEPEVKTGTKPNEQEYHPKYTAALHAVI